MTRKQAKITLGAILASWIVFASTPTLTWGKERPRVMAIENDCGLEVRVPEKAIDLGNLGPGDNKETSIEVSNAGTKDITLYIRTNILDETTLRGGCLADIMDFTINIKKDILAQDSFRGVADQENILIGTLKPGASKVLDLATSLSGEETGNEYQGASMKVSWTFVTQCSTDGDIDAGGDDTDKDVPEDIPNNPDVPGDTGRPEDNPDTPEEVVVIEDELVPLGQEDLDEMLEEPETPDDLEIQVDDDEVPLGNQEASKEPDINIGDDNIPFGGLKMPKTGQLASVYFYGLGAALIGLGVRRKKNK